MKELMRKTRQILYTDLVKISFYSGLGTFVRMFSGLISVKVVASIIGPAGMALMGQLTNFTTILQSVAGGGITSGVTRYISEFSDDKQRLTWYLSTAIRITLFLSFLVGFCLIICASYISILLLNTDAYKLVFIVFGCSIVLYSINALLMAILNGFKEYRLFIQINIVGSVVSLLFSIVLSIHFGLMGAMLSVVTYQSVVFIIAWVILMKADRSYLHFFRIPYNRLAAGQLFNYSIMTLATALIVPISQLLVRGYIVDEVSSTDAGMWEGVNRISGMYLQLIISSLGIYYLPRLSELKTDKEFSVEVKHVFKVLLPFLIIASVIIYLFRTIIITLLFTSAFNSMESLFSFQLLGDVLKMSGWILGYIMIAKAMVRAYIFTELLNYGCFVCLSILLVNWIGVKGAVIAYAIAHACYFLVMLYMFRKILFRKYS